MKPLGKEWKMEKFRDCGLSRMFLLMKAEELDIIDIPNEFNRAVPKWKGLSPFAENSSEETNFKYAFMNDVIWLSSVSHSIIGSVHAYNCLILAYVSMGDEEVSNRLIEKCNLKTLQRKDMKKRKSSSFLTTELGELGDFCSQLFIWGNREGWDLGMSKLSSAMRVLTNYLLADNYDGTPETSTYPLTANISQIDNVLKTLTLLNSQGQAIYDRDYIKASEYKALKLKTIEAINIWVHSRLRQYVNTAKLSLLPLLSQEAKSEYNTFYDYVSCPDGAEYNYENMLLAEVLNLRSIIAELVELRFKQCIDVAKYMHRATAANTTIATLEKDNTKKTSAVTKLTNRVNKLTEENLSLTTKTESLVTAAVDKVHSEYKSKIEALEAQLREAQSVAKKVTWENDALTKAKNVIASQESVIASQKGTLKDLCTALSEIESSESYTQEDSDWTLETLKEVVKNRRLVICGGSESWRKKMEIALKEAYIRVTISNSGKEAELIQNGDIVLFNRRCAAHTGYYGLVSACASKRVRLFFLENDNIKLALRGACEKLKAVDNAK